MENENATDEIVSDAVLDEAGVAFDPAIHATRKDGKPKRTPQGTWALLETATASELAADGYKTEAKANNPLSRNEIICEWLRSKGAKVKLTGSNLSVTGFSVFDLNLEASTEFVILSLSSLGYNQVGELEELLK